jgi:general secretion pathway protein C
MKKGYNLNLRKVLFISKLGLFIILLFVVFRTVLIPENIKNTFAPSSALGGDRVFVSRMVEPSVLSSQDCAQIVERNPFGDSDLDDAGKLASVGSFTGSQELVSEELGLALCGTVSGNPSVARAIIKDLKTNDLDLYRIGQTVADARIESIYADAVTLIHNGERHILRLDTESSARDRGTRVFSGTNADKKAAIAERGFTSGSSGADIGIIRRCVEVMLKDGAVELYTVDGQVEGLRVTSVENIKEFRDIGLKDGDIIRSINGHRLTSKQKAYQILKKARSQPAVNLELIRGNETKNLSFTLW